MSLSYKISSTNSRYLIPSGNGNIDVVNDFSWTRSPKSSRTDVPYIELVEYQQTAGQLIASILYFARLSQLSLDQLYTAPKDPADVYRLKYIAEPTGFVYRFPYFNTKKFSRSTNFGYEDGQNPFSGVESLARRAAGYHTRGLLGGLGRIFAFAEAGIGVIDAVLPGKLTLENPRNWDGTEEGEYSFTFDLLNTQTFEDIQQNRDLCYILKYQQSPNRRYVITDPVCIYSVYSPDVVAMPAAYMSSLEITDLGNKRIMNMGGINRTVPEAYRITITLRNLFMPSRNVEGRLDDGSATVGITTPQEAQKLITNKTLNNAFNTFTKTVGGGKGF